MSRWWFLQDAAETGGHVSFPSRAICNYAFNYLLSDTPTGIYGQGPAQSVPLTGPASVEWSQVPLKSRHHSTTT